MPITIAAAVNAEAVLAAEIFQVQALSNSQAPPLDCEQSQGDMDPSLITAGTSLPLHHDSDLATVSDPRVSLKYRGGKECQVCCSTGGYTCCVIRSFCGIQQYPDFDSSDSSGRYCADSDGNKSC